jgi:hypothetical protein
MANKSIHKSTVNHARSLYMTGEFTLEYIGEMLGVTASTVGKWKNEGDWDKSRNFERDLSEKYFKVLNYHADLMERGIQEAKENDTIYVIPKASDVAGYQNFVKRKELAFEEVVRYMSGFMEYLATTDLGLANAAKVHATAYIMKQEKLLRK